MLHTSELKIICRNVLDIDITKKFENIFVKCASYFSYQDYVSRF